MSDNKHAGRGGKGYYIALILCAAAIGITSYVYYRNANRAEEVSIQESVGEDILVGTMEAEDVPALATQPQTQSTTPATQGTTPAPTTKKPFKTTSPVSGEEISAYSMEALSYNETTRDWRVHNGVDIAAVPGSGPDGLVVERDVQNYIANKTPFETAMQDVKAAFGLTLPTDPDAANAGKLLLTDYEVENLRTAYERTLKVGSSSQSKMSQQDYELYGTYIPFSMAICHTINHKSGVDHTTYAHTGAMVNLYARGQGADKFRGVYDNTEIFHKLAELTDVQ